MLSSISNIAALLSASICVTLAADITWFNDIGVSACGMQVNAQVQMIAAVSHLRFGATPNPNNDPICTMCVTFNWQGKTLVFVVDFNLCTIKIRLTLPIRDKCAACSFDDVDLGVPAFQQLADLSVGRLKGATPQIVPCNPQRVGADSSVPSLSRRNYTHPY
jgi:hypothetical protein